MPTTPTHPARPPARSRPAAAAAAVLADLAARPARRLAAGPAVVAAAGGPPGARAGRLFLREVDAGALLGWRAPGDVLAVGLAATGRARRLGPAEAGSGGLASLGDGDRVRILVAVGTDGSTTARVDAGGATYEEAPPGGRLLDTLRRTLGLPTDPPPVPAVHLTAALWLAAIASAGGTPLSWPEALDLHPAARAVLIGALEDAFAAETDPDGWGPDGTGPDAWGPDGTGPDGRGPDRSDPDGWGPDRSGPDGWGPGGGLPSEAELIAAVRLSAEVWDWGRLRAATGDDGHLAELCPAALAAWMDDGMYARWVLERITPLEKLWAAAGSALAPPAYRRVVAVLEDCGLHPEDR